MTLARIVLALVLTHSVFVSARMTSSLDPFAILKNRQVRNLLLTVSLIATAWDLQNVMVPVPGTRVDLDATDIGLVLGSFAVATFTVRLTMPWLTRHFLSGRCSRLHC